MIIKKLYRKVKCRGWDKQRRVFESITVTDYIGWFLFGIIPIYLIELNKCDDVNYKENGQCTLEYGVFKDYGHIIRK